jgi:hypothetical protein
MLMGVSRTVSALVTSGTECFGEIGPFAVDVPWWAEVESVTARVGAALGVPVMVLRLLSVDGGEGARDGHARYHAEALDRPTRPPVDWVDLGVDPLRAAWADPAGLRELLDWAVSAVGRPLTGPIEQRRTWNLAGLFRLPTADGPVWLKATPPFAADESAVIAAFAQLDPDLVPTVVASAPNRLLLEDIPGVDCWQADAATVTSAVRGLVAAQAALAIPATADPRELRIGELLERLAVELTAEEIKAATKLAARWPELLDCGLPDTVVHGDFHPGNWRSDGGDPKVLDWSDAHLGNPVLDALRACDFLPSQQDLITRVWCDAWWAEAPGCDPERAMRIGEPLAHLMYAVRYQEFLDGIEDSERIYHLGDPASSIRAALRTG